MNADGRRWFSFLYLRLSAATVFESLVITTRVTFAARESLRTGNVILIK